MARVTEHHVDIISVNSTICSMAERIASSVGGLSITQYRILLRLYATRKPMKMTELSKHLALSQSAATAAADKLEQREAVAARRGLPLEDVAPQSMLRARAEGEADKRAQAEKQEAAKAAEGVGA